MIETDKYIFFYKTAKHFSNFYKIKFNHYGYEFANSEQAFMFEKAIFFNDVETSKALLKETDPMSAKYLGRLVQGYNDNEWNKVRYSKMLSVCLSKYEQNDDIRNDLLSTGNKILVEASPTDKIWGIGLSCSSPDIHDERKWKGQNLLGKVLMEVRNYLS